MKKFLCLIAMAVMLFTSCLKNEEPASLVELRQAKSALITAQAAYKTAEAALKQAEVEFQNALTAEQLLLNEMQTLLNEAQAIQNEIDALELELRQAKNAAEIAEYEAMKALYENELLANQQERERMLKQHEADMYDLLAEVAQAELDYENALKLMEASKLHLTEEQQAVIDNYVAALTALRYGGSYVNIAGDDIYVSESLSDLRQELIEANAQLKNAEFNWNHNERVAYAVLDSVAAQTALDETIKAMEEFIAFADDPDIKNWEAEAKKIEESARVKMDSLVVIAEQSAALEEELGQINDQLDAVLVQASYIANNPTGLDDAPDAESDPVIVESKKYVAEQSRIALKDSLDEAMEAKEEGPYNLEVIVPDALQHVFIRDVMIPAGFYTTFSSIDIEKDPETGLYYMSEGKVSVENKLFEYNEAVPKVTEANLIGNYKALMNRTKNLILDGNSLINDAEEVVIRKGDFANGIYKAYNTARKYWNEVLPKVSAGVANYKIGQDYDAQDALIDAHNVYDKLVADLAAESKLPTDAQKQAYLDNYVKYLNLREPLDGDVHTIVVDGKDVRLADNLKVADWGTKFTDTDLENVRLAANLTMDSGTIPIGMTYMDEDYAKQGALPIWRDLSNILWGEDKLRVSVDTEVGEDFNVIVDKSLNVWVADLGDVKKSFEKLGYNTSVNPNDDDQFIASEFPYSLWWAYVSENAIIQNIEATIANQDAIKALVDDFAKQVEKYEAEFAGIEEDIEEYLLADKAIEEEIEAIVEEYNAYVKENQAPLLARKVELADEVLKNEIDYEKLDAVIDAEEDLLGHYMQLINVYYNLFSGDNIGATAPENTKELEDIIAEIIAEYEEDIIGLSEDLNDAKKALLELRNGTDVDTVVYEQELDRLTDKVEQIEAEIDARLADIEYYEDLLKKTLDVFAGVAEEEGGSEA